MKTPETQVLIGKAVRGSLSEGEKAQWEQLLAQDPSLRAAYEEEAALERLLYQLPDVPVSSNFTALVVQAAARGTRENQASSGFKVPWFRSVFGRTAAVLGSIAVVGMLAGIQYQRSQQAEMAAKVRSFTEVVSVVGSEEIPPQEVLQNFDAIQRLSFPAEGELDLELLVALQK